MPRIEPFRGILYNPKKVNIAKVVAPPYDVIPPEMQNKLYRADAHNIIRLILGKEEKRDSDLDNKYVRARSLFTKWLGENVLVQDERPAIYVYSQEYLYKGTRKTGLGFIARMEIEDPRTSRVLPHENTFAKPKADRLNLIREVKANLSCIFTLFQDEGDRVSRILKGILKKKPAYNVRHDSVRHKLWKLEDAALIKKIQQAMRHKDIFIADGHHRYEVATIYRDEMRKGDEGRGTKDEGRKKGGYDYVMMYFAPIKEEWLTILATHRLIKHIDIGIEELLEKLAAYFQIKTVNSLNQLFRQTEAVKTGEYAFGMCDRNRNLYLLKLKKGVDLDKVIKEKKTKEWKRLDVSVLHGLILDNILGLHEKIADEEIIYTRDPDYAKKEIEKGNCDVAFFLNPTKVNQVRDIARIADRMPHKSTYFYPKLLSGLVINKLN